MVDGTEHKSKRFTEFKFTLGTGIFSILSESSRVNKTSDIEFWTRDIFRNNPISSSFFHRRLAI